MLWDLYAVLFYGMYWWGLFPFLSVPFFVIFMIKFCSSNLLCFANVFYELGLFCLQF